IPERNPLRHGRLARRRLRLSRDVRRRRLQDRRSHAGGRRLIQRLARDRAGLLEPLELIAAALAAGDVRVDLRALVGGQLPVDHPRADVVAVGCHRHYPDPDDSAALGGSPPSSTSAARNFSSAYLIRLFTVGSDAPTAAAISANGISITSRIRNTSRWSGGSAATASSMRRLVSRSEASSSARRSAHPIRSSTLALDS